MVKITISISSSSQSSWRHPFILVNDTLSFFPFCHSKHLYSQASFALCIGSNTPFAVRMPCITSACMRCCTPPCCSSSPTPPVKAPPRTSPLLESYLLVVCMVGRILNRFTKDQNQADEFLPVLFFSFLESFIYCLAGVILVCISIPW